MIIELLTFLLPLLLYNLIEVQMLLKYNYKRTARPTTFTTLNFDLGYHDLHE